MASFAIASCRLQWVQAGDVTEAKVIFCKLPSCSKCLVRVYQIGQKIIHACQVFGQQHILVEREGERERKAGGQGQGRVQSDAARA